MRLSFLVLFAVGPTLLAQDAPAGCTLSTIAGRDFSAPALPAAAVRFVPDYGAAMAALPAGQLVFVWHNGVLRLDPPMVSYWTSTAPVSTAYGGSNTIMALLPESDSAILLIDGPQVKRLHSEGAIDIIAGSGVAGFSGDGGPAVSASLSSPSAIAFAADHSLLIGDGGNFRIRRVDANGIIQTIAGLGGGDPTIGEGGPADRARIGVPVSIAAIADGSVYFLEGGAYYSGYPIRLRVISPDGAIHTVNTAAVTAPAALGVAPDGSLLIADNSSVRSLDSAGVLHTVRSSGGISYAFAADGSIYVNVAQGSRIVERLLNGTEHLAVGNDLTAPLDGVPATALSLSPVGLASSPDGHLYVLDSANSALLRLRDDGSFERSSLQPKLGYGQTERFAFDSKGRIIYSAAGSIVRVELDGSETQLVSAGNGAFCSTGRFAVASDDSVYAAEVGHGIIDRISPDGQTTVVWQSPVDPNNKLPFYNLADATSIELRGDGSLLVATGSSTLQVFPDGSYQVFLPGSGGALIPSFSDLFEDNGVYLLAYNGLWLSQLNGDFGLMSLDITQPQFGGPPVLGSMLAPDGKGNVYLAYGNQVHLLRGYAACASTITPVAQQSYYSGSGYTVTPGMPVTLSGVNLGPLQRIVARPDSSGLLPTTAGGVQVSISGTPAPILSAQSNALQFQIPYGMDIDALNRNVPPGSRANIQVTVTYKGTASQPAGLMMVPTSPSPLGASTASPYGPIPDAIVRNADGSPNSVANPAAKGSVIAIYFYGAGELDPPRSTGEYPTIPVRQAAAQIAVVAGGVPLPIAWSGEVPGQPGLYQVNVIATPSALPAQVSVLAGVTGVNLNIWVR